MLKLLLAFAPAFSFAQMIPMGARSSGVANASVALTDTWSFFNNPANSANVAHVSGGLYYENRYLLKELQFQGLVYNQPLKVGALSLGIQSFGFKYFRTFTAGLGYSLKLNEMLFSGVQLSYQGLWFSDYYGTRNAVMANAGILIHLSENLKLGTSIFNLGRTKVNRANAERWSTDFRLGASFQVSKVVLILAELNKNVNHPIRVKAGVEYQPVKTFFLRTGISTSPIEISGGFGYQFKNIDLSFGTTYIPVLGFSPNISFSFDL